MGAVHWIAGFMSIGKHQAIRVVSAATMNDPGAGSCRPQAERLGMGMGIRRPAEHPVFAAVEDPVAAWAAHHQGETHG